MHATDPTRCTDVRVHARMGTLAFVAPPETRIQDLSSTNWLSCALGSAHRLAVHIWVYPMVAHLAGAAQGQPFPPWPAAHCRQQAIEENYAQLNKFGAVPELSEPRP